MLAMERIIDAHLASLTELTNRLEQIVLQNDSDPSNWLELLEEREDLMSQLKNDKLTEASLTNFQREQLARIYEVNKGLLSLIETKMRGVQGKLNNIQRSKLAMSVYSDVGSNGYGAFFDRKK